MSRSTTSRPSESAPAPPRSGRRKVFHPLRVAQVDRITEDAVTITFDVPDELREDYRDMYDPRRECPPRGWRRPSGAAGRHRAAS